MCSADRLVGFTGVVEVSQGWEVFDLLGGLIKLIVFLKFPMQYIDNLPAAQAGISNLFLWRRIRRSIDGGR